MFDQKFKIKVLAASKEKCGFVALTFVLIILGVSLMVGLGIGALSMGEAKMGLQKSQSSQVYFLANLCAEQALMELKDTGGTWAGTGGWVDREGGQCQVEVQGSWTVNVSATFSNQTKKIKIILNQIDPEIVINSWSEVANF